MTRLNCPVCGSGEFGDCVCPPRGGYYAAMADVEREIRNAARRCYRTGERDKASAYNYAASLIRRVLKETP